VTLEQAICFAAQVHEGQVDKAGAPYILHPLRVMQRFGDLTARRVAVLHDVVEDGGVALDVLRRKRLPEEEVLAVAALSRVKALETYTAFIERLSVHPLARLVKLADLADNLDVTRLLAIGPEDEERLERYRQARRRLGGEP
jgi:(p)ppGpp synthase/HD superfamily hydrolase